jgi:hypothetical protein
VRRARAGRVRRLRGRSCERPGPGRGAWRRQRRKGATEGIFCNWACLSVQRVWAAGAVRLGTLLVTILSRSSRPGRLVAHTLTWARGARGLCGWQGLLTGPDRLLQAAAVRPCGRGARRRCRGRGGAPGPRAPERPGVLRAALGERSPLASAADQAEGWEVEAARWGAAWRCCMRRCPSAWGTACCHAEHAAVNAARVPRRVAAEEDAPTSLHPVSRKCAGHARARVVHARVEGVLTCAPYFRDEVANPDCASATLARRGQLNNYCGGNKGK